MTMSRDGTAAVNQAIGDRVDWYLRRQRHPDGRRRTQTDLARLLGIEQSAVSKKLAGRRPFYPHELYAIAEWLDRPLSDFLPATGWDSPPDIRDVARGDNHEYVAA